MANLAIVGSHAVNGVAAVHSELVKTRLVPDFYELWPEKFQNKTNGVTPRQWIMLSNPGLSRLITEAVGEGWVTDLEKLRGLEALADDSSFRERFLDVKKENKRRLAWFVRGGSGSSLDENSMVDSQVKRIHEYKRQLLNVLHVVWDYLRIVEDGYQPRHSRSYVFSGKAAPGYWTAKQIIELIHAVDDAIEAHHRTRQYLNVMFVPNYSVTAAERIIPATDLSEQVSTAGFEASGTGNMKFALNGALTIGTLDGANIEIAEEVGRENMFIFGHTVEQIEELRNRGAHPREYFNNSERIRRIMDKFLYDRFSPGEPEKFRWVYQRLVESWDPYFHLADLDAYLDAHAEAEALYDDPTEWTRRAILNVARMGKFSSDRTISEYARDIWDAKPI
jgi:starch phosphorylase